MSLNPCITQMNVNYDVLQNNQDNHLLVEKYKTSLANREIVFSMNDKDLIKLYNDESPVLHVKLTSPKVLNRKSPRLSLKSPREEKAKLYHSDTTLKTKRSPRSEGKIKLHNSDSTLKNITFNDTTTNIEPKKRKRSLSKNIIRSKTADDVPPKLITENILIDNIIHKISYNTNRTYYNVFKIEKIDDHLFCNGIIDMYVPSKFLIDNEYESKYCFYDNVKYEMIYTKPLNFKLPVFVCEYVTPKTALNFVYLLPKILDGFVF